MSRFSLSTLGLFWRSMQIAGIGLKHILLPAMLAAFASVCEGASLALLIPALQGILTRDVSFIFDLPGFRSVFGILGFTDGNDPIVIVLVVAAAFLTALARTLFQFAASMLTVYQVKRYANNLRVLVFKRLLSFGKLFFDRSNAGQIQELLTTYVTYISHSLSSLKSGLYSVLTLVIYVLILCSISLKLTLFAVAIFPLLFISVRAILTKIAQSSHQYVEKVNLLAKQIGNSLASIPLVKAYSAERDELKTFSMRSSEVADMEFAIERKGLFVSPVQEIILLLFLFVLVSLVSMVVISNPELNLASYAVFLLILKRAAALFSSVNNTRSALAGVVGPLQEILSLFDDADKFFVPDGSVEFTGLKKEIEFKHLSYTYPDGVNALDDISFTVKKGESLALVGESGAGKSTIVSILMRFYDCLSEQIFVDGIDVRDLKISSWHSHIALVSQDTHLFHATIRDNLKYGLQREVSDAELWEVLERARLSQYIKSLPNDLDTQVGDRGVKLSGGEKQRVAIARAMLKRSEILLLDEATSALDSLTEKLVQEAIEELMKDCTTIMIAHRLSTIRNANKVVVLEKGRIVETGDPDKLKNNGGAFASYWAQQQSM